MRRGTQQIVFVALVAAVLGFALAAIIWSLAGSSRRQDATPAAQPADVASSQTATAANVNANDNGSADTRREGKTDRGEKRAKADESADEDAAAARGGNGNGSFWDAIGFERGATFTPHESWTVTVPRILLRLLLATLLAGMLAYRPRPSATLVQRNPYVAQTQILLAIVASGLMMVVGDNAARAFGIFAAASLVRFRTNIRDPKETVVLLLSLAIGLATGVGRIDVAIVLAFFVLALLWLLERKQEEQAFRAMELTVKTRDTDRTQAALEAIFKRRGLGGEVRQINPPDEGEPVGCVMYFVQMPLNVTTDAVNEEIMQADPTNVESIEWDQQKSRDYIYQ
ncbi:MAG: DUF4956 domain-containing protein [Acidobacteria bacterium]|nr:DUF4956 domain-containing protein [Acidobacteriota bacterium]